VLILELTVIFASGVAAGFINILAGGGSLLTMPILIFLGLPAATANGTNRVGLAVETLVGVAKFRERGLFNPGFSLELALPAVVGAILGSSIAIKIPDEVFEKVLAVVMILILALILRSPKAGSGSPDAEEITSSSRIVSMVSFFFVGLYGGFVQAGVGFVIIAALSILTRLSLVRINSIKIFVVGVYIIPTLIVFVVSGNVNWLFGAVLAAGMGLGAWVGAHVAVKKGDRWIKVFLVVTVLAMAAKLSGVLSLL